MSVDDPTLEDTTSRSLVHYGEIDSSASAEEQRRELLALIDQRLNATDRKVV